MRGRRGEDYQRQHKISENWRANALDASGDEAAGGATAGGGAAGGGAAGGVGAAGGDDVAGGVAAAVAVFFGAGFSGDCSISSTSTSGPPPSRHAAVLASPTASRMACRGLGARRVP